MISAWWLVPAFIGGLVSAIPIAIILGNIAVGTAVGRGLNW